MPKLFWISYISPYIAWILTYLVLKVLQKMGKLKIFDKYLWSPFVVAAMAFIIVYTVLTYDKYGEFWFVKRISVKAMEINDVNDLIMFLLSVIYFTAIFSQTIWISAVFQTLSIIKNKKIYLNIAIIFAWIGVLVPIIFEIFIGATS